MGKYSKSFQQVPGDRGKLEYKAELAGNALLPVLRLRLIEVVESTKPGFNLPLRRSWGGEGVFLARCHRRFAKNYENLPVKRKVESTIFIRLWQEVLKRYLEEGC